MSEFINNREVHQDMSNERKQQLKEIIIDLHKGKSLDEVKKRFKQGFGSVNAEEIAQLEQALMQEEGITPEEIQKLCTVHASVFKGSIEDIHRTEADQQPGHPVHTFIKENKEIDLLLNFKIQLHLDRFVKEDDTENILKLIGDLNLLADVDKHYSRKENLLFPYLEKYGITGPSQVMWAVDDFIRKSIKEVKRLLEDYTPDKKDEVIRELGFIIKEGTEMIYKEENILLPMALRTLTEDEWLKIAAESDEIGYCQTAPEAVWQPERLHLKTNEETAHGYIKLPTGILSVSQLEQMLNHLPVDITFIDENDVVRYFSHGKERIFARTKAVIGRTVQNCHPPASVHIVNKLLEDFKSGKKDVEDFWIKFKDKYVFIRYFAVRDEDSHYIGTLEFTQNIAPIQEIAGEKRILNSSE
ncbi:DUF438 domain-containing protein [Bacillus swezeyi]|uniref:PAS domain S-box protein n=1 Tax=Bacillus swezeyi TaxID=1925020 RepID=A0A1R1QBC4_9BACI|nr:DUF438 domain-containing protein [Bacillus swezeyi]MEC1262639.1 DUF438 domain-containing protein [Bacillus swezeyi]MED2929044.1 DUF438 domain-containing protein [Bacillus swezeyi]MED2944360.1 DUF438 domain-containing protein [Bacillus swezeyi]MED2964566.1 DUF438 domain-containing protein [Bacillus swezeyi]MED3072276.1 DUF438 domain-containing protein [Bacillus swezeyi]